MNDEKCYFEHGRRCDALTVKTCRKCKFRKTEREFMDGIAHARQILDRKNLERYDRSDMVTTREKRARGANQQLKGGE